MAPLPEPNEIATAYFYDPIFHALVEMNSTGWTDEDGCHHHGPTLNDAQHIYRFYQQIEALGLKIVPKD